MPAPAPARRRSWLARGLRALVVVVIALPLLYLGGVNAFLALHGLDLMFAGTNSVSAKYKSGYTLWPGRVHLRDLRIVFQDHNLQWSLDFERVSADITLTQLVRRTFHASSVQASGGVFRMRHRIDPSSKDKPWVAALPPIPEFSSPAVFEARVPEPPVSDEEYALWRVHLENVDASVKELWVHYIRYRGPGRAQGKFELLPARKLWVGPASLELGGGAMHIGDGPLLTSLSGRIGCVVDEFDVRVPVGREVFRYINTDLRLDGQGFQPKSLLPLFELGVPLGLEAEPGKLAITASIKRGRIQPGAEATFVLPHAELETQAFSARAASLRAVARMAADARGEAVLDAARVEIKSEPKAAATIELTTPSASLSTSGDDAAGEMEIVGRALELPRLRVADARALNAFSPTPRARLTGGTLEGRFSGSELGSQRRANLSLQARALTGEWNGHALTLSAALEGRGAIDGERKNVELALKGALDRLRLTRAARGAGQPYLIDIEKATLEGGVTRREEGVSAGKLRLDARSLALRTTLADGESSIKLRRFDLVADARDVRLPRLAGELVVRSEYGEMRIGERLIHLKPELRVALEHADLEQQNGRVQARLALRELVATHGDSTGQCSTFRAPEARLTLDGEAKDGKLAAQGAIELGKAEFDWGDFQASGNARVRVALRELSLASGVGELSLLAELFDSSLKSGVSERGGWETAAARASATIHAWTGPNWLGSFQFDAPGVEGRIGGTHLSTDISAKLPFVSADVGRRTARFAGEVRLTRTVVAAERMVRDWWARIELRSGLAVAKENLDLSALFSARLRDVEPGVAILDAGGVLPGWLAGLAPSDELTAEGALNRQCRLTEIQLTRALDGPVAMRGRLQSVSEAVSGAFLVRHSSIDLLSAGVSFGSDTDVSLLAGDGWFSEQSEALDRTASRVLGAPCVVPSKSCGVN